MEILECNENLSGKMSQLMELKLKRVLYSLIYTSKVGRGEGDFTFVYLSVRR